MTLAEIEQTIALFTAAGRRNIPVPISEWREFMAPRHRTPQSRCLETAADIMEDRGIDGHYVDAVREAARVAETMATSIGKVDQKALAKGKIKPVDKAPVNVKRGRKPKADRQEAGLRANRARKAKA